jgi:site-specific recombinase XerD
MNARGEFDELVEAFFGNYLTGERKLRPNTTSSYADTFRLLLAFFRDKKRIPIERILIKHFTRKTVLEFLEFIQKKRNCGNATRNNRLAAIHSFCRFLQLERLDHLGETHKILDIRQVRIDEKPTEYLTLEGIKLLLNQPDGRTSQGRRHLAVLCLMYDAGARVQEIINLTPFSLTFGNEPEVLLVGKGNKKRKVPLINAQLSLLENYMGEFNIDQASLLPLFYHPNRNNDRKPLTRDGVAYILKKYTRMANAKNSKLIPKKISCHSIRHSKAMHMLLAKVSLIKIRDFLGHDSIQTTELYARLHWDDMLAALKKANIKINLKQVRKWEKPDRISWLKKNFPSG